jgi:hypothetical protein
MKGFVVLTTVVLLAVCSTAWADCGCRPVVVQYGAASPAPVETAAYQPVISAPAETVTYDPVTPAPVVSYRVVAPAPVVVYRAPVVSYYTPAPVVAYRPAVTYGPVVYPAPVVRAKVYYPGQPVRNFFRAVTP